MQARTASDRILATGAVLMVAALACGVPARASALEVPDRPQGPVSDFAGALDASSRARLEAQLRSYEEGTRQIAVAIFPSLEQESLEDFSIRLAERWKIGGKKSSDGVLVTVFLEERKIRIDVGYGLEDRLTDAMSARIIRDVMAPYFKAGQLAQGLSAAAAAIDTTITGRPHDEAKAPPPGDGRRRVRRESTAVTVAKIILGLFIIFLSLWARTRGWGGRRGTTIFIGGSGGWSRGGGWGGGGWGGGGGSFGGGGASGGW